MALVEKFSANNYHLSKQSDYVLYVYLSNNGPYVYSKYDFLARLLFASSSSSDGGVSVVPFSRLDPESLEFFRAKLIELGGKPPELPNEIPNETTETWVRMGSKSVAHVGVYPDAQRKLTDIFNFESRQHILVNENLKTRAEIMTPPASFDSLPQATLEKALEEFAKAGGAADRDFVLRGAGRLDKKKSPLSQANG